MLAVAVVGMSIGCDSDGISGLPVNGAERTEARGDQLTAGKTPPTNPNDDERLWPFGAWTGFWVGWTVTSSALTGVGSDAVSWHDWFFEVSAEIPGTNVPDSAVLQASDIRCDSASYFRGRPAACVFWDVLPHIQYSLLDARTQEAVAHIQCAFSPSTCFPIYPDIFPTPRTPLRGQYPGAREAGLHRIPSAGMVVGDTRAASNRAEALRACTRVGRYANPGGQYPGLPATDYQSACDAALRLASRRAA
jgi:hypothetical protein